MTEPATKEKRRHERITINKEFDSFDAFLEEYVTNVSQTGVFVRSRSPLPVGTSLNLTFTVIMDEIETIEGVGEVVRVQEDPPGMGVVFRKLSNYSQEIVDRLFVRPKTPSRDHGEDNDFTA